MKQPPVIGNPLAALGCWLVGATVHVGRVLVTAGAPLEDLHTWGVCLHVVRLYVLLVVAWKL